jgi:hypothetical protein
VENGHCASPDIGQSFGHECRRRLDYDEIEVRPKVKDYFGMASAVLAVGLFLWQATRQGGWLEATYGGLASAFWALIAVWFGLTILAIRNRQHRWVIVTAPFACYPVVMALGLALACRSGNCI